MNDTKHTPTPWPENIVEEIWREGVSSLWQKGEIGNSGIMAIINLQYKIDAAHIVKCVNMYDEMVEALKEARLDFISEYEMRFNSKPTDTPYCETLKKAGAV